MTIIKHEWLRTRTMLGATMGIAVLVALASAGLTASGWPLLSTLGFMTGIAVVGALVPVLQLLLAVDHYRTSFGRTGYFTQTLPLRGSRIYFAKLGWVLLVTLVGIVVTLLLAAITWMGSAVASGARINPLLAVRDAWAQVSDVTPVWVVVVGLAVMLFFVCSWPVMFYFAVAVGSEKRFNQFGAGGPVLVYVGLYVATQVLMVASIILVPIGIGVDGSSLGVIRVNLLDDLIAGRNTDVLPLGMIPPILLITGVCLWRSVRSWNHKVSLV